MGPVRERAAAAAGKVLGARVATRQRGERATRGGVREARGARLGMAPTHGAHLPERGREGERRGEERESRGGPGRVGRGDFLFLL